MGRGTGRPPHRGSAPGDPRSEASARHGGRRRPVRAALAGVAVGATLFGAGVAVTHWGDAGDRAADAARTPGPTEGPTSAGGAPAASPDHAAGAAALPSAGTPAASTTPSPASSTVAVPATGPGTFVTARADGATVGTGGSVRRYKVLVETGLDIRPEQAAAEIATVLADPRGWTRDGRHSFRLVASGPYDFVVKIATPGTVDEICGRAGLRTRGEVNCSVGTDVVVNLKRWVRGSPEFDGPIHEYRALIINHEVGHRIGHGHETCPGPGRPAPAMMQQIKGLKGCVANAWPHDRDGTYLGGPRVP